MQSTSPSLTSDREFIPWLQQQNISLAFTTYQTNWLAFIGVNAETGGIFAFQRQFNRAMGLYCTPDRLYLSSKYQLWQLDNVLQPGQFYQGCDRLFIPRIAYTTGDIDVHDVAVTETGELIFISTLLNCLATTSDRHSCKPLWKPPFISQIINEDRCHLNGLAMVDGQPRYVTACSRSDVVDGWRDRRKDGGVAIDIASNEIVVTGLSMPHSPRFYQGKLWLLNSGTGEFGYVDLDLGKFEAVTFCPGYARGLAFWGNYAIVGLSKPRSGDGTFSGLLLDDRLKEKDADARCGLLIIDLNTGTIVHWVRIEGTITELYDVGVLPGVQKPMALGFQTQEIEQLISLEPLSEINLVTGNKKGGDKTGDRVINERLSGIGRKTSEKGAIAMSTLGRNGRFGNQLFQYAFLKLYAKQNDLRVETPKWIGQTLFGHRDPMISRHYPEVREISNKLSNARIPQAKKTFQNVDFWGFFQYHTSYYKPERDYWRSLFQPVPEIRTCMEVAIARLRSRGKTIVGLHLRRGDYGKKYFFVAPNQWYLDWLKQIWHTLENPVLFIASDELETVIKDFAAYHPITYKDLGVTLPEAEFYPDFYILSHCDRVAISNSSFSFVACMMNEQATQFVRPHLPSQKLISFDPWDSEVIFLDIPTKDQEDQQIEVQKSGDRAIPPTTLNQVGYKIGVTEQPSTSQDLSQIIAESFPTLNVLLFFQGPRDYYRPILFSHNEVFCSPDCQTTIKGDRILTIKTPVGEVDAAKIVSQLPSAQKPDLIIVKADATRRFFPTNLQSINCQKLLICGNTQHLEAPIRTILEYANSEQFDWITSDHKRHHLHFLKAAGFARIFWLPGLNICPRPQSPRTSHKYPLSFIGQAGQFHPYRQYILDLVRQWKFPLNQQQLSQEKAAEVYANSLINLNISLNGDLNLRIFEVLSSGGFLLTDRLTPQSGLELLFESGTHLETFADAEELQEKIIYFLNNPETARKIARNGHDTFWRNHRPEQNVRRLMDYIDGKGIDTIYQIETDKRSIYLGEVGDINWPYSQLKHRISIYEYLQELHRINPKLRGLFWGGVNAEIICDAVDLPRLEAYLLQDENNPADSLYDLYDRCEVTKQIQFIYPTELTQISEEWDVVSITKIQLEAIGIEEFCDRLNFRILILTDITDITEEIELDRTLNTYGFEKSSEFPLAYVWKQKADWGKHLLNQGEMSKAMQVFDRVLKENPHDVTALISLGQLAFSSGNLQQAEQHLRLALSLDRRNDHALNTLVEILNASDRRKEAKALLSFQKPQAKKRKKKRLLSPTRILAINNLYPPQELGGYGRSIGDFAQVLEQRGHQVYILTSDAPYLGEITAPENNIARQLRLFGTYHHGLRMLQNPQEIEAVIRHNDRILKQVIADFSPQVCLVGNIHFLGTAIFQPLFDRSIPTIHHLGFCQLSYRVAETPRTSRYHLAAASEYVKAQVEEKGYPLDNISVIYPGAKVHQFQMPVWPNLDKLRIAYAGLIMASKGIETLLQSLQIMKQKQVAFECYLAGDCINEKYLQELQKFVKSQGLSDRVQFLGLLNRDRLIELFGKCNVLVFPSIADEAFGISQIEGMAAGLTLITTGVGGAKEVIESGISGIIVPPGDAEVLAQELMELIRDRDRWERITKAGQRRAVERFAIEKSVDRLESRFSQLLRQHKSVDKNIAKNPAKVSQTKIVSRENVSLIFNQALTYQQQGEFAQAIPLYQQALTAEPDNALVLTNYGKALQKVSRHQEAIDILGRAIKLNPNNAQLYFSLSQSLKVQGDIETAAECLQKAIELQPDFWGAYNNLGTIFQQQGNLAEAAQCYAKALEYNPNFAQAQSNLGSIWQLQGDLERAKAGLIRALQLEPNYVPALLNLAYIYKQQGRLPGAIDCYQQVLAQEPRPEAYYHLGEIFDYQGNIAAALDCYQKVQELDPKNYNIEGAIAFTRLKICDWEDYELKTAEFTQSVQKYLNQETAYSPSPLALSNFPVPLALHRQFAESLSRATVAKMAKIKAVCNFAYPKQTDKLKIGYISPDFREHAVGKIVKNMFEYCDRVRFEVYAYSTIDYNDAITENIRNGCDYFVNISAMTAEAAARKINADGIHILIDLAGRTIGNGEEILALQPAPIQAHFLGYPDTMGADFIQYAIGDKWLINPEIAETYTEEIIYLPHAFFSSPMEISEPMMTRAEFGIPEDAFVFCCFNSHYKITPDLFDIWMRILAQIPNSVLWLTGGSEILIANLRREAAKRGIDGNRLFFTEKLPNSEYLARYRLADLFLDTFIYNGGSTAISALYAGCPVLTRPGNTNAARMGASICAAAKLNSLICSSSEEYEKQAIYLATHPRSLGYYRRQLTKNRDQLPLFNVRGFVRTLENALWQMWELSR